MFERAVALVLVFLATPTIFKLNAALIMLHNIAPSPQSSKNPANSSVGDVARPAKAPRDLANLTIDCLSCCRSEKE